VNVILAGRQEVSLEAWQEHLVVQVRGAAIGSVVPVVGTATGAVIGAILGRFVAGATAGAVTGASLDGVLFDQYECRDCEHTFD
jgi:outer membrane lipoprotein SlyB